MKQAIEILPTHVSPQAAPSVYSRTSISPVSQEALRTYSSPLTSHEFLPLSPSHTACSPVGLGQRMYPLSHDIMLSASSCTPHYPMSESPSSTMTTHWSCSEVNSPHNRHVLASHDSLQTHSSHKTLSSASSPLPYIHTSQSPGPVRSHHSSPLSREAAPSSSHASHSPMRQCCGNLGTRPSSSLALGSSEKTDDSGLLMGDRAEGPRILKKVLIPGTGWTLQVNGTNQWVLFRSNVVALSWRENCSQYKNIGDNFHKT